MLLGLYKSDAKVRKKYHFLSKSTYKNIQLDTKTAEKQINIPFIIYISLSIFLLHYAELRPKVNKFSVNNYANLLFYYKQKHHIIPIYK